ncbi:type II toxin-antitoxin system RelE family toxin [Frankia sp. CiP1_Cm_nod1]|uniref:type II toxin-antitoxin system RelE family toxin n=1 Tax=Frankia sp. CiP1_Cm_nod1 TaxID=2897160 RepID=UPI004044D1FF
MTYRLEFRPRAVRQLERLPEKISTAVLEFAFGALRESPYRVGHSLRGEYAGQYSARRGASWRVRYEINETTHTVQVLDISHRSDAYR